MRRIARPIAFATLLALGATLPSPASSPLSAQGTAAAHAWLFGSWTGGLFPAPSGLTAESCLAQPVVIFTRELVLRATLTERAYSQRVIATVRATAGGFELRFEPGVDSTTAGVGNLLGLATPEQQTGFGCESADVLHVQRRGDNEISFPACADFPNPLVRCPAR
jgi:hypothetical protein